MADQQVSDEDLRVDDRGEPVSTAVSGRASSGADTSDTGGQSIFDMVSDKATGAALADVQKKKVEEEGAEIERQERQLKFDRSNAQHFLNREGVGPDDLQKWDAQSEARKYHTDPLDSFGSLASVFAIAASAFTKTPMTNALNGAAAAMNAVRERDDQAYDRAYKAWKDNTDLVIKRHNMMHEDYQDALSLFNTDMQLGEAKLKAMATKYGDQQLSVLMEHGYFPQIVEIMEARARAAAGLQKTMEESDEYTMRKKVFDQAMKQNPNMAPAQKLGLFQNIMGAKTDAEQQFNIQYWAAHPATGDPKADYDNWLAAYKEFNAARYPYRMEAKPGSKQELVRFLTEELHQQHPEWSPAELATEANRQAETATTKRTEGAARQETRDAKSQELQQQGIPKVQADIEADRYIKLATMVPSGNRMADLQDRDKAIKYSIERINEAERLMKKHNAITGLGGRLVGRPTEVMGNILGGSNSSDFKQFQRLVNEMQMTLPRVLLDAKGRPLGSEAEHVRSVVAGLEAGDTLANTMRAYSDLKKQLMEMRADTDKQLRGEYTPGEGGSSTPPAEQSGQPRWMTAPVVQ